MRFTIEQLDGYFTRMSDTNWNKYVSESNLTYACEFLTGQVLTLPSFIPTYVNCYILIKHASFTCYGS